MSSGTSGTANLLEPGQHLHHWAGLVVHEKMTALRMKTREFKLKEGVSIPFGF